MVCGAACGGALEVTAHVVTPAAMPVRAFPHIWVAPGVLESDAMLADALVAHLREGGRSTVRRVELERLEPLRAAGRIPAASVVVQLESDFDEEMRTQWSSRPETQCGPLGCYTTQRPFSYDVPTLDAKVVLTVFDGPTARVLQRLVVRSALAGSSYETLHAQSMHNLVARLEELVDARARDLPVELLAISAPAVRAALADIGAGRWRRGRLGLEHFARTDDMHRLEPEERARVLYDIAQARRFDLTFETSVSSRLARAERVLRSAIDLDSEEGLFMRALAELGEQRRDEALLREQREAADHNFRLGAAPGGDVPPPPPSYERGFGAGAGAN